MRRLSRRAGNIIASVDKENVGGADGLREVERESMKELAGLFLRDPLVSLKLLSIARANGVMPPG